MLTFLPLDVLYRYGWRSERGKAKRTRENTGTLSSGQIRGERFNSPPKSLSLAIIHQAGGQAGDNNRSSASFFLLPFSASLSLCLSLSHGLCLIAGRRLPGNEGTLAINHNAEKGERGYYNEMQ